MRAGLVLLCVMTSVLLAGCGGGSDSDSDTLPVYMGGVWRGNLSLIKNDCRLAFVQGFNFTHLVSQFDTSIELVDEQGFRFSGQIVGNDGFSVDALGPTAEATEDGRLCDFTYRYRYDSVNDDDDRTAEVRLLYIGNCYDGSECESEFSGDGMRD